MNKKKARIGTTSGGGGDGIGRRNERMTDKDIAECTTRIVVALIEKGNLDATEYPRVLNIYKAIHGQILQCATEARGSLQG